MENLDTADLPTCGECVYARYGDPDPQDVSKRPLFCRRNPPQVVSVPLIGQGGGLGFALHTGFPQVQENTPGCGEFDDGTESDDGEDLEEPLKAVN